MKLNNHGWGLMAFLVLSLIILMVIFLVAGEIRIIENNIH